MLPVDVLLYQPFVSFYFVESDWGESDFKLKLRGGIVLKCNSFPATNRKRQGEIDVLSSCPPRLESERTQRRMSKCPIFL